MAHFLVYRIKDRSHGQIRPSELLRHLHKIGRRDRKIFEPSDVAKEKEGFGTVFGLLSQADATTLSTSTRPTIYHINLLT